MSKPFRPDLPLEIAPFLAETISMNTEEIGAYTLLVGLSWHQQEPPCSIPDDDAELARMTRMPLDRWAECRHRVLAGWTKGSASRLYHKRLRQTWDKLKRKHAARVQAAMVAVDQRRNKSNDSNEYHTNRSANVKPNVGQSLQQNVTIPPHPPGIVESFSLTSESLEEQKKASIVVTPLEASVTEIAKRMYNRHPAIRRCSISVIQKQLRGIIRKISLVPLKIAQLEQVDSVHAQWCESWEWMKDDGQFAKNLERWLAPTKERWDVPPPETNGMPSGDSRMAKTMHAYSILPKL